MSDQLKPLSFQQLTSWILREYKNSRSVFGIPEVKWHRYNRHFRLNIYGSNLESPIGPAAGPHTQMTQNIISAYLTGSRFFELKTVQILDDLRIDKPCIDAPDEGYNVEWSQELKLNQSYDEYLKAWLLIHFLNEYLQISEKPDIIFNMSVGYDLKGIQSEGVNKFTDGMINADNVEFNSYKEHIKKLNIIESSTVDNIPSEISRSVTLSTMHGCPHDEIESIVKYLIKEKGLHTNVKLNPTLLSYEQVNDILSSTGFGNIEPVRESFKEDLKLNDAIPMLIRLKHFAEENKKEFGIKLSNTLAVKNTKGILPGERMYLSGRALFPLTINLASVIAPELDGDIRISFSGGASVYNTSQILSTGITPVTFVTDLLKPGGYQRISKIAESISHVEIPARINIDLLRTLAHDAMTDNHYQRNTKKSPPVNNKKQQRCLQSDVLCSRCVDVCPNRANILHCSGEGSDEKYLVVHIDDLCNECGNCETFCPCGNKPYKDKYTVSLSEDIFNPDLLSRDYPCLPVRQAPDGRNPRSIREVLL